MRLISNKALRLFIHSYPQADKPLQEWRKKIEKYDFNSFADLKRIFNSLDKVGEFYVFDVAGNHYRVIAAIHFNTQTLYIRKVLTHAEYENWSP